MPTPARARRQDRSAVRALVLAWARRKIGRVHQPGSGERGAPALTPEQRQTLLAALATIFETLQAEPGATPGKDSTRTTPSSDVVPRAARLITYLA